MMRHLLFLVLSSFLYSSSLAVTNEELIKLSDEWVIQPTEQKKVIGKFPKKFEQFLELRRDNFPIIPELLKKKQDYELLGYILWSIYTKTEGGDIEYFWVYPQKIIHTWYGGYDKLKRQLGQIYENWSFYWKPEYDMNSLSHTESEQYGNKYLQLKTYNAYSGRWETKLRSYGTLALPFLFEKLKVIDKHYNGINQKIALQNTLSLILSLVKSDYEKDYPNKKLTKESLTKWWKEKGHKLYPVLPKKSRPCPCEDCKRLKQDK